MVTLFYQINFIDRWLIQTLNNQIFSCLVLWNTASQTTIILFLLECKTRFFSLKLGTEIRKSS